MRSHEKSSITFIRIRSSSLALMHMACRSRIAIWICWSLWNQIYVRQSEVPRSPASVDLNTSQWMLSYVHQKKSGPACETSIHFSRKFSNLDAPSTSHPGETDAWVYKAEEDFRTATTMVRKRREPAPDNGFAAGTANRLGHRSGHFQYWFVKAVFGIPASIPRDRENQKTTRLVRRQVVLLGQPHGSAGPVLCIAPPYHHRFPVSAPWVCAVSLLTVHTDPVRLIQLVSTLMKDVCFLVCEATIHTNNPKQMLAAIPFELRNHWRPPFFL